MFSVPRFFNLLVRLASCSGVMHFIAFRHTIALLWFCEEIDSYLFSFGLQRFHLWHSDSDQLLWLLFLATIFNDKRIMQLTWFQQGEIYSIVWCICCVCESHGSDGDDSKFGQHDFGGSAKESNSAECFEWVEWTIIHWEREIFWKIL